MAAIDLNFARSSRLDTTLSGYNDIQSKVFQQKMMMGKPILSSSIVVTGPLPDLIFDMLHQECNAAKISPDTLRRAEQADDPSLAIISDEGAASLSLCRDLSARNIDVLVWLENEEAARIEAFLEAGAAEYITQQTPHRIILQRVHGFLQKKQPSIEKAAFSYQKYLQTLVEIISFITDLITTEELLSRMLQSVSQLVPHDRATILLFESNTQVVVGREQDKPHMTKHLAEIFGGTPTFQHLRATHEPVIFYDTENEPDWINIPELAWIRSFVMMPVVIEEELAGLLILSSAEANSFSRSDVTLLQPLVRLAVTGILRVKMQQTINTSMDEITALYRATSLLFATDQLEEMGELIAQAVVQELHQVDCGVLLIDEARQELRRLARAGDYQVQASQPLYLNGSGLVPEAIRQNTAIYSPDVRQNAHYAANEPRTRSELVVPLRGRHRIIGVLDLQSDKLDAFSEVDQRIIKSFAANAAAAIENVRLTESVQRYVEDLESLVEQRTDELIQTKLYFETLFNTSTDAIAVADVNGHILQTNPSFDRLFDRAAHSSLFSTVNPQHHAKLEETIYTVMRELEPQRIELQASSSNTTPFIMDAALYPIMEGARINQLVYSLRDITRRKQVELELRNALEKEQELSALRSRFVTTVSHGFRTPMTRILSSTDLLQYYQDRLSEEQKADKLSKIRQGIAEMTDLLERAMIVSKAPTYKPGNARLDQLWQQAVETVRASEKTTHQFTLNQPDNPIHMIGDPNLIQRAIYELLLNAVRYSSENTPIECDIFSDEGSASIRIRDYGIGIAERDHNYIFDAFHRGSNVENSIGSGLGLTIVKQIMQLHKGSILFESTLNAGTCMTLQFPSTLFEG